MSSPLHPAHHDLPERFLSAKYPTELLAGAILPLDGWHPYPTLAERAAWLALPEAVRQAHIALGEEALAEPWPHLPGSLYLQFARNGNRRNYEKPYFQRRTNLGLLVLAECMEGQGRFVEAIADGLWSICEESSWCIPAHIGAQAAGSGLPDIIEPILDLFAGETAALLAWSDYLLGAKLDEVSPLIRPRIRREVETRVLTPALERDDFWWMGFTSRPVNNWNPWVNSNWLTCVLLLERDENRRQSALFKILESLDRFITPYPKDGGCDEGPSYWGRAGASLFDCLELLYSASAGRVDVFGEAQIQEIGRFVYRAHIDGDYYINFADAPARLTPEPALVFRYGRCIGDEKMVRFGAWLAGQIGLLERGFSAEKNLSASPGRALPTLFTLNDLSRVEPQAPLLRDVWLPEIQVMAARDQEGSGRGLYLAAKGGHNGESHNHNDVGHFIVYLDGRPLIVDAGVETYTRKTFSAQRYEIWTMQSAYHSLPMLDGVMQDPGREFEARNVSYAMDDDRACCSLDLAGAYPPEAKLQSWQRTLTLLRGKHVEIVEMYELSEPVNEISFNLVTPCAVTQAGPGVLALAAAPLAGERVSAAGQIEYDPRLTFTCEEIPISDERLSPIWGPRLARIQFHLRQPDMKGKLVFRVTA